jgi:hypothetical protein
VITRYYNKEKNDETIYRSCYKIKLIDIASLTYLKDLKNLKIKKDLMYPRV